MRRVRWLSAGAAVPLFLCAALALAFLFTACSTNKNAVAAGLPDPDRAFQTGTAYGYDVFLWDCYQGKHIAVYRTSAEMRAGPFEREEVACGELAPIEVKLAGERQHDLDPKSFW